MGDYFPFGIANSTCVDLDTEDPRDVTCYILYSGNEYNGNLGARISAVFVILVVSTAVTVFPVLSTRVPSLHIPKYVYLFARYFGTGVIIATSLIHLLDPSYYEIGSNTCVGSTGNWALYSWPPAIAMGTLFLTFLMDLIAERYVQKKYGVSAHDNLDHGLARQSRNASVGGNVDAAVLRYEFSRRSTDAARRQSQQIAINNAANEQAEQQRAMEDRKEVSASSGEQDTDSIEAWKERAADHAFKQQIAAFLILEFGVLFHSVIIGLTLGASGSEFSTLYPVIVFHQSFEGLGIGARLSAIPFPKKWNWLPWALCLGYGLTTPIAIAAGLGVRTTYNSNGYTPNVVAGVLDAMSAGILVFTGLVELLARDFLFNPDRTDDDKELAFMVVSMLAGAGLMGLLGKWA